MTHQRTAAKEKAMPVPRRLTLLTKNVEEDKEENDKQRVKQKKITGYKIAKWIKTNYIRREEELDARITEETQINRRIIRIRTTLHWDQKEKTNHHPKKQNN